MKEKKFEQQCEWCLRRIVSFGHPVALIEVVVAPDQDYQQVAHICADCHRALQKMISKRSRHRRLGFTRQWAVYLAASGSVGLALALPPGGHVCHAQGLAKLGQDALRQAAEVITIEDGPVVTQDQQHVTVRFRTFQILEDAPPTFVDVGTIADKVDEVFNLRTHLEVPLQEAIPATPHPDEQAAGPQPAAE